jgi:hypothetical protein
MVNTTVAAVGGYLRGSAVISIKTYSRRHTFLSQYPSLFFTLIRVHISGDMATKTNFIPPY